MFVNRLAAADRQKSGNAGFCLRMGQISKIDAEYSQESGNVNDSEALMRAVAIFSALHSLRVLGKLAKAFAGPLF